MRLRTKKAQDIKIINIEGVSVIADYFIIASGTNHNQVQAMADSVDGDARIRQGHPAKQTEGYQSAQTGFCWITATSSYISLIRRTGLFYDLERIWRDGKEIQVEEL